MPLSATASMVFLVCFNVGSDGLFCEVVDFGSEARSGMADGCRGGERAPGFRIALRQNASVLRLTGGRPGHAVHCAVRYIYFLVMGPRGYGVISIYCSSLCNLWPFAELFSLSVVFSLVCISDSRWQDIFSLVLFLAEEGVSCCLRCHRCFVAFSHLLQLGLKKPGSAPVPGCFCSSMLVCGCRYS